MLNYRLNLVFLQSDGSETSKVSNDFKIFKLVFEDIKGFQVSGDKKIIFN